MVSYQDLLVGLVVLLLLFGAKRLPELAWSLGKSMTEFKNAVSGTAEDRRTPLI
jgi:sec-independent protein translocase protein TatA